MIHVHTVGVYDPCPYVWVYMIHVHTVGVYDPCPYCGCIWSIYIFTRLIVIILCSDENKESLGDGLLQYSVDNQSAKSALSLPPPINTPDDASTVAVGDDDDEHVQTSSSGGIKRALPLSPSSVSCDPSDNVVSGEGGPVIKRRNLALYEEKADEEEKEEAV